jgi:hypothetical protein
MVTTDGIEERRIVSAQLSDFGASVLRHPEAVGLYEMWRTLADGRAAPFRAELDAARIGARAPHLVILESVSPSNFRIRIAGDRVNRWFGLELRGMSALSLVAPAARNHFQALLNRVTGEPAVAAALGVARRADGVTSRFDLALMPMRSDFGRIDRVLCGVWLLDAPAGATGPLRLDADSFVAAPVLGPGAGLDPLSDPPLDHTPPDRPPTGGAPFRTIDGGGDGRGEARRGHLRLVKKH